MNSAAPPTLLYIDDDAALARLVERGLKRQGYAVEHCDNGEAGVARIRQGGIDVVALDQYMPGLDGLETLELIQAIPGAPPVVFVTASQDSKIAVTALKAGAADYLVKDTQGERKELGQVPIDDISAVIAHAHGLSYTNNLLVALAERGIPFVLCAANHNVVGMLMPLDGNYEQSRRIDAQIAAALPTKKRLWASIVRSKLEQQAAALEAIGASPIPLSALVRKVRSGDPSNIEAQGARRYWTLLFGPQFRRDQNAGGKNALLNYGYTVLRATMARSLVAAGLHPGVGLYHSNAGNPMRLVDDLMEPFRPMVDLKVWALGQEGQDQVTPETKRVLVRGLYDDMQTAAGATPISVCAQRLAVSLAQVLLGERETLELPLPGIPLALAASLRSMPTQSAAGQRSPAIPRKTRRRFSGCSGG